MQPKIYTVTDHEIDTSMIDQDVLSILQKLKEAGHVAYPVGGSVRDLLLKRTPKDFDISTSALPEEIKQIFHRRCLLIGRRFRLAHIRFGHKIIEVSTFRSGDTADDLIIRDNQWGTPEQDVLRRDFTINGLFYDPESHSIIDYVGGWEDIQKNQLRVIGVPEARFKQDPVRMIRLLKFRARLGFQITPEARKALFSCKEEILKSSPARILEEFLRMLESGAAAPFFQLLEEAGLLKLLYPSVSTILQSAIGKETYLFLRCADKINKELGKNTLDRTILLSCLLFSQYALNIEQHFPDPASGPHSGDLIMIANDTLRDFQSRSFMRLPRRSVAVTASILSTQLRLTPKSGKTHHSTRVTRYKEFELALAFLKIRAIIDKNLISAYTDWKTFYRHVRRQSDRRGHHNLPPQDTLAHANALS